jgi:Tn3 transposase DDE domain
MMAALDHLRSTGYVVNDEDLWHLTPLLWEHI